MKILYIGDIMGEMGIKAVETVLPGLVEGEGIEFVVAQSENVSDGKGMTLADFERLKSLGIHAFSGGNHSFAKAELYPALQDMTLPVVGPANMTGYPGSGHKIVDSGNGKHVLVISVLGGIVGMQSDTPTENPLQSVDNILARTPRDAYYAAVVNIHGDFSSEKLIMGYYLDGRVSLVVGDHWHIPTADLEILPKKTARITDVGMCGSLDSSLGVKFSSIIPRWRDGMQTRNEMETEGRLQFCAVMVEVNDAGDAVAAKQIRKVWQP